MLSTKRAKTKTLSGSEVIGLQVVYPDDKIVCYALPQLNYNQTSLLVWWWWCVCGGGGGRGGREGGFLFRDREILICIAFIASSRTTP